jgi:hypothetical protein
MNPVRSEILGRHPLVVAWGGGVNSTAVLVGLAQIGVRPDLILFADTGGEKPETYQFRKTMNRWLFRHDFPLIQTVVASTKTSKSLEDQCLNNGTLPSIVFGWRTCSQRWKLEAQEKFINGWPMAVDSWGRGEKIVQIIGYHADEPWRIKDHSGPKADLAYPLVEWGWGQWECLEQLSSAGLPDPGKSACFFCPSSTKKEVISLSIRHPDLFFRAVHMESVAASSGKTHSVDGLGRHWSWKRLVELYDSGKIDSSGRKLTGVSLPVMADPDPIPCGCFDGG